MFLWVLIYVVENTVVNEWVGLGIKMTSLWLGKRHVLEPGVATTNTAGNVLMSRWKCPTCSKVPDFVAEITAMS